MRRIRVLIADDHPVFRYGLRALLQAEAVLMGLAGGATSGKETVALGTVAARGDSDGCEHARGQRY